MPERKRGARRFREQKKEKKPGFHLIPIPKRNFLSQEKKGGGKSWLDMGGPPNTTRLLKSDRKFAAIIGKRG